MTTPLSLEANSAAAPQKQARPSRYYRPELDLLRLLAVVMVFQFHFLPFPKGASAIGRILNAFHAAGPFGVAIFFTLSAFLISELLLREISNTGTVHIQSFYLRRVLRIWPLFFLLIGISVLVGVVTPIRHLSGPIVLAFSLMVGNWYVIFHGWPANAIGTLWSISVEEQFYVLWPGLMKKLGSRGILLLSVLFWCLSFLVLPFVCNWPSTIKLGELALRMNSLVQFQFFALGGLLAYFFHHRKLSIHPLLRIVSLLAGFCTLLLSNGVFHLVDPSVLHPARQVVPAFLCTDLGSILVFLAFFGMTVPGWCKPLTYLGKISYGLYMFPFVSEVLLNLAFDRFHLHPHHRLMLLFFCNIPVTIALAMLSYRYFESPFLRLKNRFTFVKSREV